MTIDNIRSQRPVKRLTREELFLSCPIIVFLLKTLCAISYHAPIGATEEFLVQSGNRICATRNGLNYIKDDMI